MNAVCGRALIQSSWEPGEHHSNVESGLKSKGLPPAPAPQSRHPKACAAFVFTWNETYSRDVRGRAEKDGVHPPKIRRNQSESFRRWADRGRGARLFGACFEKPVASLAEGKPGADEDWSKFPIRVQPNGRLSEANSTYGSRNRRREVGSLQRRVRASACACNRHVGAVRRSPERRGLSCPRATRQAIIWRLDDA